jgi:hypothetical protein
MWHALIALALVLHGIGHAVGFWMPVPTWFALAWLLPGAGFVLGAWAYLRRAQSWTALTLASAAVSLALVLLAPGTLAPGPYSSAFVFDVVVLAALLIPAGRRRLAAL